MELQQQIVEVARKWADAKVSYKHRGKTMKGCDCSGLLIGIINELGYLKNFKVPVYPPDWNLHGFAFKHNYITDYISKYANKVEIEDKQPGDVLLFKYFHVICHSGIYIGNDLFIHSYILRHVWYGTLKNSPYSDRLVEVWRLDLKKMEESK